MPRKRRSTPPSTDDLPHGPVPPRWTNEALESLGDQYPEWVRSLPGGGPVYAIPEDAVSGPALARVFEEGRARKTVVKYRGVFDLFINYLDRHRVGRLAQVTAGHFDQYRAERKQTRHPKTIYCEGVILKQLFKWAKTRKLIIDNPFTDIKLNKPPLEPKPRPNLKEVNALLTGAAEPLRSQ